MSQKPFRIMIDSNIRDRLLEDAAARTALAQRVQDAQLVVVETYVQHEEVARTPDGRRRQHLQQIVTSEDDAPAIFALDICRLDLTEFGGPEEDAVFDKVRGGNPKHAEDAVIAATAIRKCDALVTADDRLLRKLAESRPDFPVWDWAEFCKRLSSGEFG